MDNPPSTDKRTVLEIAAAIEYVKSHRNLTPEQASKRVREVTAEIEADIAQMADDRTSYFEFINTHLSSPPLIQLRDSLDDVGLTIAYAPLENDITILGVSIGDREKYSFKGLLSALHIGTAFERGHQWFIGDLINIGFEMEGELFAQYAPKTGANWASVCKSYPLIPDGGSMAYAVESQLGLYRWKGLYFGHHETVASLAGELLPLRGELLSKAHSQDWSVEDLRHQKYLALEALANEDSDLATAAKKVLKNIKATAKADEIVINCTVDTLTDHIRYDSDKLAKLVQSRGSGGKLRVVVKVYGAD